jgi:hypothetical protein
MAQRKRTIPRAQTLDPETLAISIAEYLHNRSMRERSEYHEGRVKKDLMAILEIAGEQRSETTQAIDLDGPLPFVHYKDGKPIQKKVIGIERRKRTSNVLDEDKTLGLLRRKGLLEECTETVVVVNEDAVLAANYAGRITDKELAALYEEKTTYAFYPTEDTSS